MDDMKGKVVIITGAKNSINLATAQMLDRLDLTRQLL